jgi:cytochrome c553
MQAVAQNLSDSDMRALAVFFSNQHPPLVKAPQPPAPELVAAGKQLAEMGAGTSVLACFSCHAAGGKGNGARFPGIAGEPAALPSPGCTNSRRAQKPHLRKLEQ